MPSVLCRGLTQNHRRLDDRIREGEVDEEQRHIDLGGNGRKDDVQRRQSAIYEEYFDGAYHREVGTLPMVFALHGLGEDPA